jgi:hypothetical protein
MNSLVTYFGCGKINQASNATYFVVQRLSNIMDIIIPRGLPASSRFSGGRSFLDKHPLVGVKVKDF